MKTLNDLTVKEFKELLAGYFAKPKKRQKLNLDEIRQIAKNLNTKINVPLITETGEEKILIKIVVKIDTFLYNNLPNEFYDLIRSSEKGIDEHEAKRLIIRLSKLANRQIDIPYIPENMEYLAIRFVLGMVINAARRNWDFLKADENAKQMQIPQVEDANDNELASIIV
ncbi:MAG: hypothetical protein HN704_09420 [Bacteroidetes bacterium]|jgi:hypothetical protein|nr:hypothetical protein [Bacteroidota bacterium]MBT6684964.1 hypothetical protein [Bacteroidota bacterium]MBT7144347.1 hypothetical protein [Bacteroidota bacterium]MBT7491813.1 hypothetical protein [Bacteroidota bacterium]